MTFRPDRMRKLREGLKLTQKQLAQGLGVEQQHVSRWERGTHIPSLDIVSKIADRLNTTSDFLLNRTSDPKSLSDSERRFISWLRSLAHEPTAEDTIRFFASQDMPKHRQPRAHRQP